MITRIIVRSFGHNLMDVAKSPCAICFQQGEKPCRDIEATSGEAVRLGETLAQRGWEFKPWDGLVVGWVATPPDNSSPLLDYNLSSSPTRKDIEAMAKTGLKIKGLMRNHVIDKQTGVINCTLFAELIAYAFDRPDWLDDETHYVWDVAVEVAEKYEASDD